MAVDWNIRVGDIYELRGAPPLGLRVVGITTDKVSYVHRLLEDGFLPKGREFGDGVMSVSAFRAMTLQASESLLPTYRGQA
jgi:hypothetical protein